MAKFIRRVAPLGLVALSIQNDHAARFAAVVSTQATKLDVERTIV
jgi:hypothetical protein